MRFEWDEAKNRLNFQKHGITFQTAQLVFDDLHALSYQDYISNGEERWQTFGMIGGLIVMAAHTFWDEEGEEVIRIMTAGKASSRERSIYEAHKKSG